MGRQVLGDVAWFLVTEGCFGVISEELSVPAEDGNTIIAEP